jgi:hypothetical protein
MEPEDLLPCSEEPAVLLSRVVSPSPKPRAGGPSLIGCPQLFKLMNYIYLQAVSCMRLRRACFSEY